jgi:hypothetical protein
LHFRKAYLIPYPTIPYLIRYSLSQSIIFDIKACWLEDFRRRFESHWQPVMWIVKKIKIVSKYCNLFKDC